jgi:L-asparaginase
MKPQITFILTGGTIDKEYDALDKAFTIGSGAVSRVLGFVKPNFEATIVSLFQKVSVHISEKDKKAIAKKCKEVTDDKIVVTYGTDAMTEIGKVLNDIKNKTIVITGALKSQLIKDTDAEFNLGFAVAAVQTLPHGVYIAMSGRVYPWNKCKKNRKTGQFIEIK